MRGMVRNGNDVDRQKKEWEYFSAGTKKPRLFIKIMVKWEEKTKLVTMQV